MDKYNHKEKKHSISSEDLYNLLEHIPRPIDVITIECPLWYKKYMENKYGKVGEDKSG